jgi:hypothetical protein
MKIWDRFARLAEEYFEFQAFYFTRKNDFGA